MITIRYSKAFKLGIVKEVEKGILSSAAVSRKHNIRGSNTVVKWVRKYGNGTYGKVIRVEQKDEMDEVTRLRRELRRVKEALADTHVELAMEKAFLGVACEELNQSVEAFKKKRDGERRTKR